MKKILLFLGLSILLGSCKDNLDLTPVGSLTGSNFYKTDYDAVVAVNGVYIPNSKISSSFDYLIDGASDAVQSGEEVQSDGGSEVPVFAHKPSNAAVLTIWTNLFQGVSAAGAVIDGVGNPGTSVIKARVINEAKFLRALYYFYAVQLWGEVPLVLHPNEGENATRASIDDVYAQIVADLNDAKALPASTTYGSSDKGRASRGAAWTLLAKVYLVWAQTTNAAPTDERYRLAVEAADKVIELGDYKLQPIFTDNWQWDPGKRDGEEIIFSAHHAVNQFAPGEGGNHMTHCSFAEGFKDSLKTNHLAVTNRSFYDRYDVRDQRRDGSYTWTLANPQATKPEDDGYTPVTFRLPLFRKAINVENPLKGNKDHDLDRIILRFSEVYLLKAEALNEQGNTPKAYEALNVVRRRAFKEPLDQPSTLAGVELSGSSADFKQQIQDERYFEFVFEQQRWFDLVRWRILVTTVKDVDVETHAVVDEEIKDGTGKVIAVKWHPSKEKTKHNVSQKHYRFPIPQVERDKNPIGLWQNWGYDGSNAATPAYASYR